MTFSIDDSVIEDWKLWLKSELQPYMNYHKLENHGVLKVHAEQSPGTTAFNVQFLSSSVSEAQLFMVENEPKLLEIIQRKFKEKCLVFSAVLEAVSF